MPAETFPAWDLVRTGHQVQRHLVAAFDDLDLSPPTFGVLAALGGGGSPSQAELAREVLVTPQSVAAIVSSLADRGLVEREEPAGRGGRAGIALTPAGRAVLDRALPTVRAATAGGVLGLDDAETATLLGLLAKVRAAERPSRPTTLRGASRPSGSRPTPGPAMEEHPR